MVHCTGHVILNTFFSHCNAAVHCSCTDSDSSKFLSEVGLCCIFCSASITLTFQVYTSPFIFYYWFPTFLAFDPLQIMASLWTWYFFFWYVIWKIFTGLKRLKYLFHKQRLYYLYIINHLQTLLNAVTEYRNQLKSVNAGHMCSYQSNSIQFYLHNTKS